jgi:hypothetical protein
MTGRPDTRPDGPRTARSLLVQAARLLNAGVGYTAGASLLLSTVPGVMARPPLWSVIVATAVIATVLWMLREPVDRLADRIVYRRKASGYAQARALLDRMAAALPIDEVLPQLAETAGRVARSSRAEVRLWVEPDHQWREVWPEPQAPPGDPLLVGVQHLGTQVGEIEVDGSGGLAAAERRQLDQLAVPAGTALATVRLTYALRRRRAALERATADVDASTRRLLGARREEQQRFRDHITARVLPHLDAALTGIPADHPAESIDAVAGALDEVRSISRGLFPPRLAAAGLAVSLRDWRDATGPAARMDLQVPEEVPEDLQTCVFFCVANTLTALDAAGSVELFAEVRRDGTDLLVQVGGMLPRAAGVPPAPAGNLAAAVLPAADRVAAFDGRCETEVDGQSMRITARIPLTPPAPADLVLP